MINFRANYIGNTPIKQLYNNKYVDTKANLIELNPNNNSDLMALKEIGNSWYCGSSLAAEIYLDAKENYLYSTKNKQKFYALTSQKDTFEKLNSEKILAVIEAEEYNKNILEIIFLQVHPYYNYYSYDREYKKIGSGLLDIIKKIYSDKIIILKPVFEAINFYLKNGFKELSKHSLYMYYKSNKNLTKKP